MVSKGKPVTAKEWKAKLSRDPEWVKRREADARGTKLRRAINLGAQKEVLKDLATLGVRVESISDLPELPPPAYRLALPVLLDWLARADSPSLRQSIVSALRTRQAKPVAARPLLDAFDKEIDQGLRWSIASALAEVADDSVFGAVKARASDARNGKAREMLVLALGKMRRPERVDVLLALLGDPDVAGHAIVALGRAGSHKATKRIEPLTRDTRAWVRAEARKFLRQSEVGSSPRSPNASRSRTKRSTRSREPLQ
jgi:HEAT repeat protein